MEKRFTFRKELVTSNFAFKIDDREKLPEEISVLSGVNFIGDTSPVIEHAKADFFDYLKVCFGVKKSDDNAINIVVKITKDGLEDVCDYKGRVVEISDNEITIHAFDDRGAAQAIYDLEDAMTEKKAPYLTKGKTKQKPVFDLRMAYSAYDLDVFPNGYLQRLAKDGVDAILVFTRGVNKPGNPALNILIVTI